MGKNMAMDTTKHPNSIIKGYSMIIYLLHKGLLNMRRVGNMREISKMVKKTAKEFTPGLTGLITKEIIGMILNMAKASINHQILFIGKDSGFTGKEKVLEF